MVKVIAVEGTKGRQPYNGGRDGEREAAVTAVTEAANKSSADNEVVGQTVGSLPAIPGSFDDGLQLMMFARNIQYHFRLRNGGALSDILTLCRPSIDTYRNSFDHSRSSHFPQRRVIGS